MDTLPLVRCFYRSGNSPSMPLIVRLKLNPSATPPTPMLEISLRSGDEFVNRRSMRTLPSASGCRDSPATLTILDPFSDLTVAAELSAGTRVRLLLKLFNADSTLKWLLSSGGSSGAPLSFLKAN